MNLPESFTNVRPAHIAKTPTPPKEVSMTLPSPNSIQSHLKEECAWLEQVCLTENVTDAVSITWAVHHATQTRGKPFEVSISSLLPLIRDQAHSVATMLLSNMPRRGHIRRITYRTGIAEINRDFTTG